MNLNKNSQALKITTGAMFLAIFAILLLVNRQTGGFFEEFFIYLLPIPMVAYASIYNWKSALTVFAGMCAFAFFFGTFTSAFYAITAALIGLVLGTCLYYKVDLTLTMCVVMVMSAVFNVLSSITLASLFGYDIQQELVQMQKMMDDIMARAGSAAANQSASQLITPAFLLRMMIVSMVILGLVQGFVVYRLSLILLRRLRFQVPQARSLYEIYPPRWTGPAALAAVLVGSSAMARTDIPLFWQSAGQMVWICGYIYLVLFGVIGISLLLRVRLGLKGLSVIISMILFLVMGQLLMFVGLAYISMNFHQNMMEAAADRSAGPPRV